MPNYKLTIEYDGTGLNGWQKQKEGNTAQNILEDALSKLFDDFQPLTASGRTDAGVHALGQVANFESEKEFDNYSLAQAINFHLINKPVSVVKAEKVSKNFSARFSAKERFYRYAILNRPSRPVLDVNRVWHVPQKLDIDAMKQAAEYFIGLHDFTSFRASQCQAKSPLKTINKLKISKKEEKVFIDISALSFMHHMVRNITGTLVEVGKGSITPEEVKNIIAAKDRAKAKQTAPACGLYFMKVRY